VLMSDTAVVVLAVRITRSTRGDGNPRVVVLADIAGDFLMAMITLSNAVRLLESIRRRIGTLPLRAATKHHSIGTAAPEEECMSLQVLARLNT
jgi:hypothetical protein